MKVIREWDRAVEIPRQRPASQGFLLGNLDERECGGTRDGSGKLKNAGSDSVNRIYAVYLSTRRVANKMAAHLG